MAEYQSRTGEIHVVVFNRKNGKFNVGRYEDPAASPKVYSLKDGGNTGTMLDASLSKGSGMLSFQVQLLNKGVFAMVRSSFLLGFVGIS